MGPGVASLARDDVDRFTFQKAECHKGASRGGMRRAG
jgi:hypothetical protein